LAGRRHDNASQVPDTSGLYLAPAKMNCQPFDAVERMLRVHGTQERNIRCVLSLLRGCGPVAVGPANLQDLREPVPPPRIDFFQDGYFFGRCISAVALPIIRYAI